MSTIEKLFVEIFERKKRIIDQVKQQAQLFDQHLAATLLLDGINPPSWLLHSQIPDPNERKKEDLISEVLLSHPQVLIPFSASQHLVLDGAAITADDKVTIVSNRDDFTFREQIHTKDERPVLSEVSRCGLNVVPAFELTAMSPIEQRGPIISDPSHSLDQSLARIQRSKTRQKALELRNSAKASGSSLRGKRPANVDNNDNTGSGNVRPLFDRIADVKLDQMSNVDTGSSGRHEPRVADFCSKEKGNNTNNDAVAVSMISELHPPFVDGSVQSTSSTIVAEKDAAQFSEFSGISSGPNLVIGDLGTNISPYVGGRTLDNLQQSMNMEHPQNQSADISDRCVWAPQDVGCSRSSDTEKSVYSAQNSGLGLEKLCSQPRLSVSLDTSFSRLESEVDREADFEEVITGQNHVASGPADMVCSRSCDHQTVEKSISSGQYSSACLEDLSPDCRNKSIKRRLAEHPSVSQRLKSMPLDNVHGNCPYTSQRTEVDHEVGPEEIVTALNGNAGTPQDKLFESCDHKISGKSAPSRDCISPGLENVCSPSGQRCAESRLIKPPSSLHSLKMSPDGVHENFQDGSSSGVEVDLKEVTIAQSGNARIRPDFHSSESYDHQILEKTTLSGQYPIPRLENMCAQSDNRSYESSLIKPLSSPQSLKINPHTDHENFQDGSTVRVEVIRQADPKEIITAPKDSANTLQDVGYSKGSDDQTPEESVPLGQYSSPGSENLCPQLTQTFAEIGLLKPPQDRKLSRFEVDQEAETMAPVTAQRGCANSLQDVGHSTSGDDQIPEKSAPSEQHSNTDSENLCPQSMLFQERVKSAFTNPPFALQSSTPFGSVHGNEDSSFSREDVQEPESEENFTARSAQVECPNVSCNTESVVLQIFEHCAVGEFQFSPTEQTEEGEIVLQAKHAGIKECGVSIDRNATRMNLANPQVCSSEVTEMTDLCDEVLDPIDCIMDDCKDRKEAENGLKFRDAERSANPEGPIQERVPQLEETFNVSSTLLGSTPPQSLELSDGADPTKPVLEGFILQAGDDQSCISEAGCSFEKFDFEDPMIKRASALEQLCKSACKSTPLTHWSTADKLHKGSNLYQSVPNGLLEYMELRSTLPLENYSISTLRSDFFKEEVDHAFDGKSYSDCLPFVVAQNAERKTCTSPVGKLWDRIKSISGSSKAKGSLNPELPCISEENEVIDEVVDTTVRGFSSEMMKSSAKRKPLADITEDPNYLASVTEIEDDALTWRCSLESTNTECYTGTKKRPIQKPGNHRVSKKRYTDKMKDAKHMQRGTSVAKISKESLRSRFSKPKTSLQKDSVDISAKDSKRDNIVCNMTSFLPLVQQNKATAPLTGKRDVKVKALGAAEAAKRQAEKREMERKMKKEALKLERARMEQEKKQKEEERRKKEAEIAAGKRMREEEERREKERKRKRIDEARRHQQEQKEKSCAKKEEREAKNRVAGEKKDAMVERIMKHEGGISCSSETILENGSTIPEFCGTPQNCRDGLQSISTFSQMAQENFVTEGNQEPSYEISPYRCSDDEDEDEDDDEPNDKFVPSWASKSRIAMVVSSQQRWDPDVIFPRDSFCSISEVVLPRKYQMK